MDKNKIQVLLNNKAKLDPNFLAFGAQNHGYQLNAPITESDLTTFEQKLGCLLPTDYRDFLLKIGNGGAGAGYGLIKLNRAVDNSVVNHQQLLNGFPPPPCDLLPLCDHGCGSMTFIAISGKEHGEIWEFDDLLFRYLPVLAEPEDLSYLYDLPQEHKNEQIDRLVSRYYSIPKSAKLTFTQWYQAWLATVPYIAEGAETEFADKQTKQNRVQQLLAPLKLTEEDKSVYAYFTKINATQRVLLTDDDGKKVSLWCLKTGNQLSAFENNTYELGVDNIVSASGNWLISSIEEDFGNAQGAMTH